MTRCRRRVPRAIAAFSTATKSESHLSWIEKLITPYPLRTAPLFRDYLWGGRKLQTKLGKELPDAGIWAESWEFIDHPEHCSVVSNGELRGRGLNEITRDDPAWLLGADYAGDALPLLLKFLDCQRVLSVQVHPDDSYAARMSPPDLGKTEAWYIIDCEPGAILYAGLKQGVDRALLNRAIQEGNLEDCLHVIRPVPGDCVFIPAGTIHALGAGLLVAEIQQASNTTFRLFDWDRVGPDGRSRDLHIEESLSVIDFASGPRETCIAQPTDQPWRSRLVQCDKFVLDRLQNTTQGLVGGDGRFHLLAVPSGEAELQWQSDSALGIERLRAGQSVLLPAAMEEVRVQLPDEASVLLDMYLP